MANIVQLPDDWQEGFAEPLTGDEEEAARTYIDNRLREWGITDDEEDPNIYIMRAWDEWIATDEAQAFAGHITEEADTIEEAIEYAYADIPPAERPVYVWCQGEQYAVPEGTCRPVA